MQIQLVHCCLPFRIGFLTSVIIGVYIKFDQNRSLVFAFLLQAVLTIAIGAFAALGRDLPLWTQYIGFTCLIFWRAHGFCLGNIVFFQVFVRLSLSLLSFSLSPLSLSLSLSLSARARARAQCHERETLSWFYVQVFEGGPAAGTMFGLLWTLSGVFGLVDSYLIHFSLQSHDNLIAVNVGFCVLGTLSALLCAAAVPRLLDDKNRSIQFTQRMAAAHNLS